MHCGDCTEIRIILKIKLAELSFYNLIDHDLRQIFFFDRRLRTENLYKYKEDKGKPKFGWEEIRWKASWDWDSYKKDLLVSS